jgi:lipopolysaccharide export LptBFGC system permease protein LptF
VESEETPKGGDNHMKRIIALVMGIAFAFCTAGFAAAQTPAPKAEDKMEKKDDKDKKGDKKAIKKKGDKDKTDKTDKDKMDKDKK